MKHKKYHASNRRKIIADENLPNDISYLDIANKLFASGEAIGDRPETKEDAAFVISRIVQKRALSAK